MGVMTALFTMDAVYHGCNDSDLFTMDVMTALFTMCVMTALFTMGVMTLLCSPWV